MSDPTDPVAIGTGAFQNFRSFLGRGAKVSAPVTAFCGAIADLASTIGQFSLYLLILSVVVAIISGFMWYSRFRRQHAKAIADGVMQADEVATLTERNGWSVTFAFSVVAAVVMGGFVIAARVAGEEDKGVLASVVPGMDKVQEMFFQLEKKIDDVKTETAAIKKDTGTIATDTATIKADTATVKTDTARIAASVEEIARRFDSLSASGGGGLIANASTPEQHYHNARMNERGLNPGAARKDYMAYLAADLETIDPWLNFSGLLKVQEGKAGALETLRYFSDKSKSVSYQVALALLEEREPRLAKLEALEKAHPDYGPLPYLLSQEYSELKRGDTTLADQRTEKAWLEKFRAAHGAGKVVKYFIDKKAAQEWLDAAEARWTKLSSMPAKVMENPVSLTAMQSGDGWAVTFLLTDYRVKELFYRLDGQGDFKSTGHQPITNTQTGLPMVTMYVPLPGLTPGEHMMEVRYVDKNDQQNGPYTLKFSTLTEQLKSAKNILSMTGASWVSYRDFDGKLLLYFTTLMTNRHVLKEVRYSINQETLDKTFEFTPTDKPYEAGDKTYTSIPTNTEVVFVQLTYKDDTKSPVQRIERKK